MRNFIYRSKYRYGQYLPLKVPVDVSLELASHCNMRCTYCYHADQNNLPFTKGFMRVETAAKIIGNSCNIGVNSLKMNWKGESTMSPHFHSVCKWAKELASGSTFQERITNSNFKFSPGKEHIFEALCYQTKVKVSFDSFRKEVFEEQRARGNWPVTYKNIDTFYNWPGRDNELVIQAVRTKLNKDEDIEGEVKRRWPSATVSIRDVVEGRTDTDMEDLVSLKRDDSERKSCLQAHVRLIFNHEGRAHLCCPDIKEELCVGDIKYNTVAQIFNSPRAKLIRKQLKDKSAFKLYDACKNCSSFESYAGFKPNWGS